MRIAACALLLLSIGCVAALETGSGNGDDEVRLDQDDIIIDPGGGYLKIEDGQGRQGPGAAGVLRADVGTEDYLITSMDGSTEYKRVTFTINQYWGGYRRLKIERDDEAGKLRLWINDAELGQYCDMHVSGACERAGLPAEFSGQVATCKVWTDLGGAPVDCPAGKLKLDAP